MLELPINKLKQYQIIEQELITLSEKSYTNTHFSKN